MHHLFIDCPVSTSIWNAIDNNLISTCRNGDFQIWLENLFKSNNFFVADIRKQVRLIGYILWHIGRLRYSVVFDNAQIRIIEYVNTVKLFISEWENSLNVTQVANQVAQEHKWNAPKVNDLKVNFDVSYIDEHTPIGIGLIMRDSAGQFMGAKGECSKSINEEQGEAVAALEAIKWAKENVVLNLHLEGDNRNVVSTINAAIGSIQWTTNSTIQECRHLLNSFYFWTCSHVKREANGIADVMTKNARINGGSIWNSNPADFLLNYIQKDQNCNLV
ncbi:uncharacterized protein LOC113329818 [Papaver somniferum]|uniref:uncharacterized protein LOC113329818 n=1 Tax=Papaver somniferum TaxID=3469 RepID=UPI000E703856|nr:uncharacterized protein LOC113329818 [Papaver somniferum]